MNEVQPPKGPALLAGFSLLTSAGTLVCCALPALFVTLGAGAALAGLVTAVPQLVWLSQYKVWVFAAAGVMLLLAGVMQWRGRNAPCPADPQKAAACQRLRRVSLFLYGISVVIYLTGVFFAFIAVRIFF